MAKNTHLEVADSARAGEPDRYLAALLADEPVRRGLIAVAAYGSEIAHISMAVREPMMGEIRLQWWRERLEARDMAGSEILQEVGWAQTEFNLSLPLLLAVTEARAFDLYSDPMPDEAAFVGYLDKASSGLFSLGLAITAPTAPAELAIHAGRAYGAARLLSDLPRRLALGRDPLPRTWLSSTAIDTAGDVSSALAARQASIERVIAGIDRDITVARRLAQGMTREERVPLLPLATISPYLAAIRKLAHAHQGAADIVPLGRILRIARAHWFGPHWFRV